MQKKKGKYYIEEQALRKHFSLDHDAEPEPNNRQGKSEITHHFIDHLRTENKELHARVKELTHLVAQQNKMIMQRDDQLNLLQSPPLRKWWKFF